MAVVTATPDSMPVDTLELATCFDDCQHRRMPNLEMVESPDPQAGAVVPCCPPITAGDLSQADAERMAAMFKALSDPVRLRLFSRVASHPGGEVCVCDIGDVGVSQPTVSHHLKKLREAGLLTSERRGTWVYYRVAPSVVAAMSAMLDLRA
jgi:ArsR family transcriptional regulator